MLGSVERDVAFGLECAGVPAGAHPRPRRARRSRWPGAAAPARPRASATLSGGERQRVALAAVLAPGPAGGAARRAHLPARRRGRRGPDGDAARLSRPAGAAVVMSRAPRRPRARRRPTACSPCATGGSPSPTRRRGAGRPPRRRATGRRCARASRASTPATRAARCCADACARAARGRGGDDLRRPTAAARARCCACSPGLHAPERGRAWCWTGADVTGAAGRAALPGPRRSSARTPAATCSPSGSTTRSAVALRGAAARRAPSAAARVAAALEELDLARRRRPPPARPLGGPARARRPGRDPGRPARA